MKKVILVAAAAFALVATSFAQNTATPAPAPMPKMAKKSKAKPADASTPAPQAGEKAPDMGDTKQQNEGRGKGRGGVNNALGLSPEQETKFRAINEAHKSAVQVVQSNESMAVDAKKAQVAALVSKYESDVKGVLNADQFAKWTAMRAKRNEKKGEHKGGGEHREDGDHKKGGHKAEGSVTPKPMPAEGTATPTLKVKKSNKSN